MTCPTCCWGCKKHQAAINAVISNEIAGALGGVRKVIGCPGRNSPCAAKPGEKGCIGKACGKYEGFKP